MDLISRNKATMHLTKARMMGDYRPMSDICSEIPSAFEEMTNGEVIQALFPNADYCGGAHFMHITNVKSIGEISIPWEWWNAPYKAESEVKGGRD